MPAIIPPLIPRQSYEAVRDRIGVVLLEEIVSQAIYAGQVHGDTPVENIEVPTVWIERSSPIDKAELPSINVLMGRGELDSKDALVVTGLNTYYVDIYTKGSTTAEGRGDYKAAITLHRYAGLCRSILDHPAYRTLGFAPPSLSRVWVESVQFSEPVNNGDALSVHQARLTVMVKMPDGMNLPAAPLLALSSTSVKVDLSQEGYVYVREKAQALITENGEVVLTEDSQTIIAE
jgi:hypothetical protein